MLVKAALAMSIKEWVELDVQQGQMALLWNSFESHRFSFWKLICNRVYCVFGVGGFSFQFATGRGRAVIKLGCWNSGGSRW